MELSHAIALMSDLFKDRNDANGVPYAMHCIRVMQGLNTGMHNVEIDEEMQIIAVLHDVPEDTRVSCNILSTVEGYNDRVIKALELLTHDPNDSYDHYINGIIYSDNLDAILVKMSDLRDNSDITRQKPYTMYDEKRMDRQVKYNEAYRKLNNALNQLT